MLSACSAAIKAVEVLVPEEPASEEEASMDFKEPTSKAQTVEFSAEDLFQRHYLRKILLCCNSQKG